MAQLGGQPQDGSSISKDSYISPDLEGNERGVWIYRRWEEDSFLPRETEDRKRAT